MWIGCGRFDWNCFFNEKITTSFHCQGRTKNSRISVKIEGNSFPQLMLSDLSLAQLSQDKSCLIEVCMYVTKYSDNRLLSVMFILLNFVNEKLIIQINSHIMHTYIDVEK